MKTATEYLAVSTDPLWIELWTLRQKGEKSWGGRKLPTIRQWRVLASTLITLKGTSERVVHIAGTITGHPSLMNDTVYTTGKLTDLWQRYALVRTEAGVYYELGMPADSTSFATLYEYMAEENRLWK